MADPLSQLRDFHIKNKEIKEHNGYIIFGEHGWPKTINTNFLLYSADANQNKKEYYTLECLLHFLRNKDAPHHYYVRQAGSDNVPVVHRPDRKMLLAYLNGEVQTCTNIDRNAPIPPLRLPIADIYSGDEKSANASQAANQSSQADNRDDVSTKRQFMPPEVDRLREAFAQRLEESSSKQPTTITTNESLAANDITKAADGTAPFNPEVLAAMKAKRMAVKRTTIVGVDNDLDSGLPGPPVSNASADPGARYAELIALDSHPFQLIKSKEKVWRTRTTVLQANSKNFSKSVLALAQLVEGKKPSSQAPPSQADDVYSHQQRHQSHNNHQTSSHQYPQQAQRSTYNRYDQERFVKLDLGVQIDTKKSFVSGGGHPATNQNSSNNLANNNAPLPTIPRPVVDHQQQHQHQHQHQHQQQQQHQQPLTQIAPSKDQQRHTIYQESRPIKRPHAKKKISPVPIIVVPALSTSLINMSNAGAILQDLTYKSGSDRPREKEIGIQRAKADGTVAVYKIMDNPLTLDSEDWARVVAVFVQGPTWQFKGWPWNGQPVEIFSRIQAFHLKWDEMKLEENVAKWNVHVLELSRSKRHLDRASLLKFWSILDRFMVKCKPFLKY